MSIFFIFGISTGFQGHLVHLANLVWMESQADKGNLGYKGSEVSLVIKVCVVQLVHQEREEIQGSQGCLDLQGVMVSLERMEPGASQD